MRTGKPWTKEEEKRLVKYFEEGKTAREVSNKLGRSMEAVYRRRCDIRNGLNPRPKKQWTDKDKEDLEKKFKQGKSDEEIAKCLGRTVNAVGRVRLTMGLHRQRMRRWTEEEDDKLESLVNKGKKDKEIAKILNRSQSAIATRKSNISKETSNIDEVKELATRDGLNVKIEPLKKGRDYVLRKTDRRVASKRIGTYKGKTDSLLVFDYEDYSETYTKVDIALGEVDIREATKTDYQTIQ